MKPVFEIFYDRDKSLLWSLNRNDTGGTSFRFNFFPASGSEFAKPGYFVSHHENQRCALGLLYRLPLGIAFSS